MKLIEFALRYEKALDNYKQKYKEEAKEYKEAREKIALIKGLPIEKQQKELNEETAKKVKEILRKLKE